MSAAPVHAVSPTQQPPVDALRLRRAFGHFATGMAIVTARHGDRAWGMTINSLASVSLQPPLLLWSIAATSSGHGAFAASAHFAVHVLHRGQSDLAHRFHQRGIDRFAGMATQAGIEGTPLLTDFLVRFQCASDFRLAAGDHTVLGGRILAIDEGEGDPLVFYRGREVRLEPD